MDRFELRHIDFSLTEEQDTVFLAFADFFRKESPSTVVRAAEPLGHDPVLWTKLSGMGVTTMSLPSENGGDDASLVDMVVVAEEFGRALAPAPFISQVVTARLLSRLGAAATGGLTTLALQPANGRRQLVPDAAIATQVIALDDDELSLYRTSEPAAHVQNQGSTPLGWWSAADGEKTVLATGQEATAAYRNAVLEWKLLTSAALVGLTEAALRVAVEFTKTRETMGVPIGALQGVAFPLVDVEIGITSSRTLIRRTAWSLENDPEHQPELAHAVWPYTTRAATYGATTAAHMQGGLGFTVEADASLYFLRAKGWGALAGDPQADYLAVADVLIARAG